jgi:hypothetical protein
MSALANNTKKIRPGLRRGRGTIMIPFYLKEYLVSEAYMTREETIIELARALKALGFDIESMKLKHSGEMDTPQYVEVKLKIIRL